MIRGARFERVDHVADLNKRFATVRTDGPRRSLLFPELRRTLCLELFEQQRRKETPKMFLQCQQENQWLGHVHLSDALPQG